MPKALPFDSIKFLFAFKNSKHKNTGDNGTDKQILSFAELFVKENSGKNKRNNADAGKNGRCDGAVSAHGVNVGKLTCGLTDCGDGFVLLFRKFKGNALYLHEDEKDDSADCKGEFIGDVCNKFDVFFGDSDKGAGFHFKEENIEEASECVDKRIAEGHHERDKRKSFAKSLFSFSAGTFFGVADSDDTCHDYGDCDPDNGFNGFAKEQYAQKGAHCAGGVFDGVSKGFLDESDSEEGACHGNDIAKRNGKICDKVHGVVCNIGSEKSEDRVDSHNRTDHDADS